MRLQGEVDFIQLGSATDPALQHVNDLRGATSIREAAAILNHARLYVGTVGFLMHLARAVECPERDRIWRTRGTVAIRVYLQSESVLCRALRSMLASEHL